MEREYEVYEIVDAEPGTPHFRVVGFLQNDPLTRALIATEVVSREGDMEFAIINNRPCVRFKTGTTADIDIWPAVQRARSILGKAVWEAKKIDRILTALEMAKTE
jgi:hypothetical protein